MGDTENAGPVQSCSRDGRASPFALSEAVEWFSSSGALEDAIQQGEMIPDFELANAAGRVVGLQALLDRGPVVVAFTLGASSARCRQSLSQLQHVLLEIESLGASLVAISPDEPPVSRRLESALGLSFDVLSDPGGRLAALFGVAYRPPAPMADWLELLGLGVAAEWPSALVPLAAAYVVTTDCIADFAFNDADPTARVDPRHVLASLSRLHVNASPAASSGFSPSL